jgi:hypothetical protein
VDWIGRMAFQSSHGKAVPKAISEATEWINVSGPESMYFQGINKKGNRKMLLGFVGLSAAATLGKLWVDAIQEIEVTRVNALTERQYQQRYWLYFDPWLTNIAEREALENKLRRLEMDMLWLRHNTGLLSQRLAAILAEIGRESNPKHLINMLPFNIEESRAQGLH